jgi:hypothetical protein
MSPERNKSTSTKKNEVVCSSKMLATTCKSTWHHNQEYYKILGWTQGRILISDLSLGSSLSKYSLVPVFYSNSKVGTKNSYLLMTYLVMLSVSETIQCQIMMMINELHIRKYLEGSSLASVKKNYRKPLTPSGRTASLSQDINPEPYEYEAGMLTS